MQRTKILTWTVGILLALSGIFIYFNSPPSLMQDDIIVIKEGETVRGLTHRMKRNNLITSERFFYFIARTTGMKKIRTGKYKIFRGMSTLEILIKLTKGDTMRRRITIPEGFNLYQTAERLSANEITGSGDFLYYAFNADFIQSLGIKSSTAEGYLFPDTYTMAEESDPRDVIVMMHNRMKNILDTLDLSNMKGLDLDVQKLLTLASLVEKEAKIPSERVYVSAVFHSRLHEGMKLDCDPTVRYAVKKFRERLGTRDLAFDSPFNTYLRPGLPPTPIGSPGKESIIAALNPAEAPYLYFVSRNDGSHYFSKTLREHNRAVEFYQKGIKNGFVDKQKL